MLLAIQHREEEMIMKKTIDEPNISGEAL